MGEITKEWLVRVGCALFATCLVLIADQWLPNFVHSEHLNLNWRAGLFSPRPDHQSRQLSIVAIDDNDLAGLDYTTPIDRHLLSQTLRKVAAYRPKVIALDILFDRHTEALKDDELTQTVKTIVTSGIPVVVANSPPKAGISTAGFAAKFQDESGATSGFANLLEASDEKSEDFVVSHIPGTSDGACSFPDSVAGLGKGHPCVRGVEEDAPIDWLLPPKDGRSNFAVFGPNLASPADASADPAVTQAMTPFLKDRVVLVGGAFADEDEHKTPLSDLWALGQSRLGMSTEGVEGRKSLKTGVSTDGAMPGLLIQAQAIQQRLDGREYHDFNLLETGLICFVCGFVATLMITVKFIRRYIPLFATAALIVFMVVDIATYKAMAYNFPGNLAGATFTFSLLLSLIAAKAFTPEELPETLEIVEKVLQ